MPSILALKGIRRSVRLSNWGGLAPPAFFESAMSGLSPNSSNIRHTAAAKLSPVHLFVHPEYDYWSRDWTKIRDCIAGEREIKRKTKEYLKQLKGQDEEDYGQYLERAVFYNMTGQTVAGMLGQVFRRPPQIRNLPVKFKDAVADFAKDGTSHWNFAKTVGREQISLGRCGVMVDAPTMDVIGKQPTSFAIAYAAENIIDWDFESVEGFYRITRVLLREFRRDDGTEPEPDWDKLTTSQARKIRRERETTRCAERAGYLRQAQARVRTGGYTYVTVFRELVLERVDGKNVYKQYLYKDDPTGNPSHAVTPVVRGNTLDFIPFKFFGASSNSPSIEKPPVLDIATLNLSHYRSYAELEYGRLFTALPVYYAASNDENAEYHIGPNVVWEIDPSGPAPGILEYKAQGLGAIEKGLTQKEQQIAAIGGRLMPGTTKSVSESDNQVVLREANEQALLLDVVGAMEEGMRDVVRWWLMFRDVPLSESADLRYEMDTRFLSAPIGAREMRAIHLLYADGIIPVEVLYEYLKKAEIVPETVTLEEFRTALDDPKSFLNAPDVHAKQRGFKDRAQELEDEQVRLARLSQTDNPTDEPAEGPEGAE